MWAPLRKLFTPLASQAGYNLVQGNMDASTFSKMTSTTSGVLKVCLNTRGIEIRCWDIQQFWEVKPKYKLHGKMLQSYKLHGKMEKHRAHRRQGRDGQ